MQMSEASGVPGPTRRSKGEGRSIVLVHGNSSSSRIWQAVLDSPFGARYRCLAPDLPGHGDAAPPAAGPDDYSVPGFAAMVAAFVREEGLRDVVLVGWSLGGHVVLEAADALGDVVAGFAVFGTPPVRDGSSFAEAYLADSPLGIGFQETITRRRPVPTLLASWPLVPRFPWSPWLRTFSPPTRLSGPVSPAASPRGASRTRWPSSSASTARWPFYTGAGSSSSISPTWRH
ncbi:hypothetical protein GCM10022206_84780 [Streptomyces chiangmaiensis]